MVGSTERRLAQHILTTLSSFFEKVTERKKTMKLYQFEKIYSQMEKEFGKMRKGEEEAYTMLFCHWREMH